MPRASYRPYPNSSSKRSLTLWVPTTKSAGLRAPPVASERAQLTALESSNATIYDSMMNNYSSLCASHAGGVARAGWEALYLSEIVMSLLACLTKMYSAYGKL